MSRKEKKRHTKYSLSDEEPAPVAEVTEPDPGQAAQPDPPVDKLLSSFTIKREYLDQLASSLPKPPAHTPAKKRVFVRKLKPVPEPSERPLSKSVKVVRPLPPDYMPARTLTSLGPTPGPLEWTPGPRYTEDGQLVPYSILGTEEEFNFAAEGKSEYVHTIEATSRRSHVRDRPRRTWFSQVPRQENALKHWQVCMNARRRQQLHISNNLSRPAGHLVMNQSDNFSDRQTVRALIDRAAPYLETGKGRRSGSEFWQQQERLGDYETGIRMSLTSTERGMPPLLQLIGRPDVTCHETGTVFPGTDPPPSYPWQQSHYLSSRLRHFAPILHEMKPLNPDLSSLYVVGRGPERCEMRLGSAGGSVSSSDGEDTGGRVEGMREEAHPEGFMSPAVLVQGEHTLSLGVGEPIQVRLCLEGNTRQLIRTCVTLENVGPSVVYAVWRKLGRVNALQRLMEGDTQRFYFDLKEKVLLPGHAVSVPVIFKSAQAGIYWESWELATRPCLQPLVVTFRGVAVMKDKFQQARAQVERELVGNEADIFAGILVREIVQSIRTPPRSPPPVRMDRTHKEKFIRVNPGVEFREDLFRALQTLYIHTYNPPTVSDGIESVEGHKEGKSNAKKDETKGKTSKNKKGDKSEKREEVVASKLTIVPKQQEIPVMSVEKLVEAMKDLPEWDFNLDSLVNAVLNTSGNEMQTDLLLAQLNEILSRLNFSQHSSKLNSTYQHMYISLSQVLEMIPTSSAKIRAFYNLPERFFVDETQPDLSESVISPSELNKKKKGGLSKPDVTKKQAPKKGVTKEDLPKPKGSTPSRKGKASLTPRTLLDSGAPVDVTPELPKSAEIDLMAERAYSLQLRQTVCDLLDAAIGNFVSAVRV